MPTQAQISGLASAVATGNAARIMLGQALSLLSANYGLARQQNGQVREATNEYLDGIRLRAEADFSRLPVSDEMLPVSTSNQVAFDIASIEEATGVEIQAFPTTALDDFLAPAEDVIRKTEDILTPNITSGIGPWIIGGAIAAIVILYLYRRRNQ